MVRELRRRAFDRVVVVASQREARAVAAAPELIAVVDRDGFRSVVFQCPCGCRDVLAINVDPALPRAWRVRIVEQALTLMPSVWRSSGCESHFILWRNQVWWCAADIDDEIDPEHDDWPNDMKKELREEWQPPARPHTRR